MTIRSGTRLGPYEITAPLGAGGMGEVWRARDTRLEREVAIKILPADFAASSELLARFEREAKAISSLNHPNICTLYDVGDTAASGGGASSSAAQGPPIHYLVMELIEGESLASRLARGALPIAEVLRVGAQIADALDAAHRKGVVHRDLKPGNVMLTKSGAKLLDFGLAKSGGGAPGAVHGLAVMPTEAAPLTREGTILGTFQYMAPEQLEGFEADARTDIFSLGAVLYEMATGRRAFQGGSKTSLIAAIVTAQPEPISSVVPATPPALDHVVRKCLEKDPDDRWQSARDVASQLRWISEAGSRAGVATMVTVRRRTRERLAWVAALVVVGVGATLAAMRLRPDPAPPPQRVTFTIAAPEGSWLTWILASPDGRRLMLQATDERGDSRLWVRSIATGRLTDLQGTANATRPFWSPDGEWVAFFAGSRLFKVPADGRSGPLEIAEAKRWPGRVAWGPNGTIVFSPRWDTPLYAMSDRGGKAQPVTSLEEGEAAHANPMFLADGRLLFDVVMKPDGGRKDDEGIYVQAPGAVGKRLVLRARPNSWALQDGRIGVYSENPPRLSLRRLDPKTLELGPPEAHELPSSIEDATASDDLRLWVQVESVPQRQSTATWYDRSGKVLGTIGEPGRIESPAISPDGSHVALEYTADGVQEIRNYELRRGIAIRLHKSARTWSQMWSPDGRSILFALQTEAGKSDVARVSADGTGDVTILVKGEHHTTPTDLSRDGRWLLYTSNAADDPTDDLWLEDLENPGHPRRIVDSPKGVDEGGARFSPDGSWISYSSDESGRYEIYLVHRESGKRIRVSPDGGLQARWRRDGRELYFLSRARAIVAVSIEPGGSEPTVGAPEVLFKPPILGRNDLYDVTGDGRRFLVLTGEQFHPTSATVLLNWFQRPPGEGAASP
jgi:eukaryotic-like serine/threonine-protein kinase